ncbi:hypothetical protein WG915_00085 [Corynebacterium sp. H128]|uniref:hypothetical protein n=1 Tax=Corynebacterium sp. H128 TaxID=3133427 RepID=UPI0030B75922
MTKTLLKLQSTLWRRNLKHNPRQAFMIILVTVYAVGGAIGIYLATAANLHEGVVTAFPALLGIGCLSYLLAGFAMPSAEDNLIPESFSVLPLPAKDLIQACAIATLMQSRGVLALSFTIISMVFGAAMLGFGWVVVPMLVLQLAITLFAGQLVTGLLSAGGGRRSQERSGMISAVLGFVFIIGYSLVMQMLPEDGVFPLGPFGEIAQWTPIAAAPAVVSSMAAGKYGAAGVQLLIAVLSLVGIWWAWQRTIARRLAAPIVAEQGAADFKPSETLLMPWAPRTQGGMIYSRAFRYVRRDAKLTASLAIFPLFAAVFLIQGVTIGPSQLYVGAFLMAYFGAAVSSNDFGYDGPANWVHIVTGLSAKTLLVSRHLAMAGIVWVAVAVYCAIMLVIAKGDSIAWWVSGAAVAAALNGAAFGLIFSVHNPFATAKPGTNPWQDKSGYSSAAFASSFGALLLGWIPLVPGAGLLIAGFVMENMLLKVAGLVLMLALAVVFYLVTIHLTSRKLANSYPEIFQKVKAWVN